MEREQFVNDDDWPGRQDAGRAEPQPQAAEQPQESVGHRPPGMFLLRSGAIAALAVCCASIAAQTGSAAGGNQWVSQTLRPSLTQVGQTVSTVDVQRWKVHRDVRAAMQGDISAIQRDLSGTLAELLQQSDAAPGSLPAAFAVYRNVDALYDTLLRVVETADLAGQRSDAEALDSALSQLEQARSALGAGILSGMQTQESEVLHLRSALATALAHQQVRTTVVENAPEHRTEHKVHHSRATRHRKKVEKKPEEKKPPQP